jgi:hypothetical protein
MRRLITFLIVCVLGSFVIVRAGQATKTRVEELLQENANLYQRLAQLSAALASCEVNGPQSAQLQRQAQESLAALKKSLADRGLELKPDGTLGDLPPKEPR